VPESPVLNVAAALAAHGVAGAIRTFTESVPTAAVAAEQLGCDVGAIANSLVFTADGQPILILTSGAHRVDTTHVATLIGVGRLKRATPETVLAATGQEVGGVAPVGHPTPIRTLVDVDLAAFAEVWAGAGDHLSMFPTSYGELVRITDGTPVIVAP
jgi:prolyl-tRNA editing enzyme YbaK/EbsC (Cys-tRNA(Pro) deacylase)